MSQPDPFEYDLYYTGVSGGKDSTALLLWLRYESGWPISRIFVAFNDTGNEDSLTYSYLAYLSETTGLPICVVEPTLDFWELAHKKKMFPSRRRRFCTETLKVVPFMRLVQQLKEDDRRVLLLSGVRKTEGKSHNTRGEQEIFAYDDGYGCEKYLPLYDWPLEDIWAIHQRYLDIDAVASLIMDDPDPALDEQHPMSSGKTKREYLVERMRGHGIPRNPLYDMGATRVGCFPCINSRKAEIRAMDIYRPNRADFIAEHERSIERDHGGYTSFFHRNSIPLQWRSETITTVQGEEIKIGTIYDVIAWSKTGRGAKQFNFDFAVFDDDAPLSCDLRGMCE